MLDHDRFDYIINFNSLNEDFLEALVQCGIEPQRDLPSRNVTKERKDVNTVIKETNSRQLARVFGPFMIENHIDIESNDISETLKKSDWIKYRFVKKAYKVYWKWLKRF